MKYALKERIGNPALFCGRRQQMELLLKWAGMIPDKTAKSRALPSRRKSGKSAIMQRLFNILWNQNGAVIPFYFEMQDRTQWLLGFVDAYYRTFASQYLSFKTRTILDQNNQPWKFAVLRDMAKEINDEKLLKDMDFFQEDFTSPVFFAATGINGILFRQKALSEPWTMKSRIGRASCSAPGLSIFFRPSRR